MPRTIICTVGVSIASGCSSLKGYQKRASDWDEDTTGLATEIRERLAGFDLASEEGRVGASAEINSLHRLGCTADDEVVLLATDTADGRACGSTLVGALREAFGVKSARLVRIEGLQVRNGTRLKKEGIRRLIDVLFDYLEDPQRRYGGGVVLNPTGGFKGVVPFMTVLGMLRGAKVVYVFEFSEQLITLPPLPVSLDLDLFERARPALEWAREQAVFAPESFYRFVSGMEPGEEDLFAGFLEIETPTEATLSSLAMVLIKKESRAADYLMLSPEACKFSETLPPNERGKFENMAGRLASPSYRSKLRKPFQGTDIEVYGGQHYPARFAGFTKDDVFHLCLARRTTEHDEYERLFARKQRVDFERFTPWSIPTDVPPSEEEIGIPVESWVELRDQRDRWQAECEDLRQEVKQQKHERDEAFEARRESEAHQRDLREENRQIGNELEEARRRIQALKRDLAQSHAAAPETTAAEPTQKNQEDEAVVRPLLGTVTDCYFKGFQGRTWRFVLESGGKTWEVCLLEATLEHPPTEGQSMPIQLQSFNGRSFLGSPAPRGAQS